MTSRAALARNLLRSESAASSRIEGVLISQKGLARAVYARAANQRGDNRAAEVLGNVEAMERAIALGAATEPFAMADIQDIHRTLLRFTEDRHFAGVIRTTPSWIGGNDHHPIGAAYVGPRTSKFPDSWRISADSSRAPISPPWHRLRSRTRSSRTSTHSWTATGVPAVP